MSLPDYFSLRVFPVVRKDFPMVPSHWKNPVVYGKTKGKVSIRCDHWVIMTHLIDGCPRLPEVVIALKQRMVGKNAVMNNITFNKEQQWAFKIIHSHLKATLSGKNPLQLLMIVVIPGGMGKTVIINELTHLFTLLGATDMLSKTATSGVAATLISGTTLHYWAGLPMIIQQREG